MCEVGRACLSCLADVATSVGVALFTLSPVALVSATVSVLVYFDTVYAIVLTASSQSAIADSIDSGTSYMQATEEAQGTWAQHPLCEPCVR